jgi:hypothetical protein
MLGQHVGQSPEYDDDTSDALLQPEGHRTLTSTKNLFLEPISRLTEPYPGQPPL